MSLPVVPVADPATFCVVMLKDTLRLEEIDNCLYIIASILTLWILREVLPSSPGRDPDREGGSLGCFGRGRRLALYATAADADFEFRDSHCGLSRNGDCAPADFWKLTSC